MDHETLREKLEMAIHNFNSVADLSMYKAQHNALTKITANFSRLDQKIKERENFYKELIQTKEKSSAKIEKLLHGISKIVISQIGKFEQLRKYQIITKNIVKNFLHLKTIIKVEKNALKSLKIQNRIDPDLLKYYSSSDEEESILGKNTLEKFGIFQEESKSHSHPLNNSNDNSRKEEESMRQSEEKTKETSGVTPIVESKHSLLTNNKASLRNESCKFSEGKSNSKEKSTFENFSSDRGHLISDCTLRSDVSDFDLNICGSKNYSELENPDFLRGKSIEEDEYTQNSLDSSTKKEFLDKLNEKIKNKKTKEEDLDEKIEEVKKQLTQKHSNDLSLSKNKSLLKDRIHLSFRKIAFVRHQIMEKMVDSLECKLGIELVDKAQLSALTEEINIERLNLENQKKLFRIFKIINSSGIINQKKLRVEQRLHEIHRILNFQNEKVFSIIFTELQDILYQGSLENDIRFLEKLDDQIHEVNRFNTPRFFIIGIIMSVARKYVEDFISLKKKNLVRLYFSGIIKHKKDE